MKLAKKIIEPGLIACTACLHSKQKGVCLPLDIAKQVIIESGTIGLIYHVATDIPSIEETLDYGWSFLDLLKVLPEVNRYIFLSNTSRAANAEDAVYKAHKGVEIFQMLLPFSVTQAKPIIKLEILTDSLQIDEPEVLIAIKKLVREDLEVIPLISPNLNMIRVCADLGVTIARVLVGRIGSLGGFTNKEQLIGLAKNSPIPLIFEGGLGNIEHIEESFRLGASAVLLNSAILKSSDPLAFITEVRKTIKKLKKTKL